MAVSIYNPTGISHSTSVDFSIRSISQPVHIVQYDQTLPILAVSLFNNGQLYRLPETTKVNIRFGKKDKTYVYNSALGCNENRTIVYFEITQQMTIFSGEHYPVVELIDGSNVANSSPICIIIDRNPIQHGDVESTNEFKELINYRNEAEEFAEIAKESSETVLNAAKNIEQYAESAIDASESAAQYAELAKEYSEQVQDNSDKSFQNATLSKEYADNSKSWAIGDNENHTRNGSEDDENQSSQYYAKRAEELLLEAAATYENAKAQVARVDFRVNTDTMELEYSSDLYEFKIDDETKRLYWRVKE